LYVFFFLFLWLWNLSFTLRPLLEKESGRGSESTLPEDTKTSVYKHKSAQRSTKALKSTGGVGGCILKVMIYDTKKIIFVFFFPLPTTDRFFYGFCTFLICVLCVYVSHKPGPLPFTDIDAPIKVHNIPPRVVLLINETRNLVL
jgi:hypothetical protein